MVRDRSITGSYFVDFDLKRHINTEQTQIAPIMLESISGALSPEKSRQTSAFPYSCSYAALLIKLSET